MAVATKCGFCGRSGVTKDYLWPEWLRRAIEDSGTVGKGKKSGAAGKRGAKSKPSRSETLETKVGMSCKTCNQGWMSALENEAKPLLTAMAFSGEKTVINEEGRLVLVRWGLKTAMVYEYTETDDHYFSAPERLAFKERFEVPPNVWVWAARHDGIKPIHGLQYQAREPEHPAPAAYCLTIATGFLILQVFGYREAGPASGMYAAITPKAALVKLWPPTKVGKLEWPPRRTLNDDELQALDERFRLIMPGRPEEIVR